MLREEHMTFISTNGYVAHEACEDKKAKTIASKVVKILKHHDSLEKVQILSTDAEPANTGWKGKKRRIKSFISYNNTHLECLLFSVILSYF